MVRCAILVIALSCGATWGQDLFLPSQQRSLLSQGKSEASRQPGPIFRIFHDGKFGHEVTGRVRLYVDTKNADSPSELVFGKDVSAWKADEVASFSMTDAGIYGFPVDSLEKLKRRISEGQTIYVQAELAVYTLYNRTSLPPTWLPTSCVSKAANAKPDGTLFSKVMVTTLGDASIDLHLNQQMPDSTPKSPGCAGLGDGVDSHWVKTVRINSALLAKFWNRPMLLEACVLLPWGSHANPNSRYPLVVSHGHYNPLFMPGGSFRETKPECDRLADYDCYSQHAAYELYTNWIDPAGPFKGARALVMTVNHPVPFFDDSYAVNSASMGPYGDAIVTELIPEVERRFNGLGQGWARGLFGGSTGGWETIAQQIFYPDDFNGMLAACPDPVSFTSYVTADIYKSKNYYFYDDDWLERPRPGMRDHYSGVAFDKGRGPAFVNSYGQVTQTLEEGNHQELAMGTYGRSCGQWDAWEAVFSPACEDGYPCRLYDKLTGMLNRTVALQWRDKYDLAYILKRDWDTLGPKLQGKLNIAVGASDTFYLNNAVMDLKDVLMQLGSDANITFGSHDGIGYQHCFSGYMLDNASRALPNSVTRLHYLQMNLPAFARHWIETAPAGADITSWSY